MHNIAPEKAERSFLVSKHAATTVTLMLHVMISISYPCDCTTLSQFIQSNINSVQFQPQQFESTLSSCLLNRLCSSRSPQCYLLLLAVSMYIKQTHPCTFSINFLYSEYGQITAINRIQIKNHFFCLFPFNFISFANSPFHV